MQAKKLDSLSLICRSMEDDFQSEFLDTVTSGKKIIDGQPTLYICQQHACQSPLVGWEAIAAAISQLQNSVLNFSTGE